MTSELKVNQVGVIAVRIVEVDEELQRARVVRANSREVRWVRFKDIYIADFNEEWDKIPKGTPVEVGDEPNIWYPATFLEYDPNKGRAYLASLNGYTDIIWWRMCRLRQ